MRTKILTKTCVNSQLLCCVCISQNYAKKDALRKKVGKINLAIK